MVARAHHHPPMKPGMIEARHRRWAAGRMKLEGGEAIEDFELSYVTHGKLSEAGDNAVLVAASLVSGCAAPAPSETHSRGTAASVAAWDRSSLPPPQADAPSGRAGRGRRVVVAFGPGQDWEIASTRSPTLSSGRLRATSAWLTIPIRSCPSITGKRLT